LEEFVGDEDYKECFASIPVPEMNKKSFPLVKESIPEIFEKPKNNDEISIVELKNKFKKK
jgi:hypothetical protein